YLYDARAAAELKKLADRAAAVRARKPAEDFVRALTEVPGRVPTTFLFHRGDPDQPKQPVPPGGLTVLDDVLPLRVEKAPGRPADAARLDPDGRLLGRMPVRRLEAEAVRDGVLAVSGGLSLKMFGPAVPVRENDVGQVVVGKGNKDLARGTTAVVPLPGHEA